jgi:hypothetical protein
MASPMVGAHLDGAALHRPGTAGDLVHCLALHAQRGQKRADLRRRGLALHDLRHGRVGLVGGQVLVREQLVDCVLHRLLAHAMGLPNYLAPSQAVTGIKTGVSIAQLRRRFKRRGGTNSVGGI